MKPNMSYAAASVAALLIASSAYGVNYTAPSNMPINDVSDGSYLAGLPQAGTAYDPKHPVTSFTATFSYRNGAKIADAQALDGTVNGINDPRMADGNVTCTAFLNRLTMPQWGQMTSKPAVATQTTTFVTGKVIKLQQADFKIDVMDQWHTVTHNEILCYKVGQQPMTVADVAHALGGSTQVLLSTQQSADLQEKAALQGLLGVADQSVSHVTPPQIAGQLDPKTVITDQQTDGNFVSHPLSGGAGQTKTF